VRVRLRFCRFGSNLTSCLLLALLLVVAQCSAKESTNVHQAIMALVRRTMKQIQDERQAEHEAFAVQPPPNVLLTDRNAGRAGAAGRSGATPGKGEKNEGKSSCCA
jgi:hypothetical protein